MVTWTYWCHFRQLVFGFYLLQSNVSDKWYPTPYAAVVSGGLSKAVTRHDLMTAAEDVVGTHDAAVKVRLRLPGGPTQLFESALSCVQNHLAKRAHICSLLGFLNRVVVACGWAYRT